MNEFTPLFICVLAVQITLVLVILDIRNLRKQISDMHFAFCELLQTLVFEQRKVNQKNGGK